MPSYPLLKLLILYVALSPLVGICLFEAKLGLTMSIAGDQEGYFNGASLLYLGYLVVLYLGYAVAGKISLVYKGAIKDTRPDAVILGCLSLMLNISFLLILLFGFEGYKTLTGEVPKGLFRASLGSFGSIAYILLKFTVPLLLTNLAVRLPPGLSRSEKVILGANLLVSMAAGMTFGFKTGAIYVIFSSLIIIFRRLTMFKVIIFCFLAMVFLIGQFYVFDINQQVSMDHQAVDGTDIREIILFLLKRATIAQGDMLWYVWGLMVNGELEDTNYWNMLLPVVGDKAFSLLTGITKDDTTEWILSHYDIYLTFLAGYSDGGMGNGHSVVGTPAAEGLVALGYIGPFVFAVIAGVLLKLNYNTIRQNISDNPLLSATATVYFVNVLIPWLSGGAIIQLVHVSVIAGLIASVFLVKAVNLLSAITISNVLSGRAK